MDDWLNWDGALARTAQSTSPQRPWAQVELALLSAHDVSDTRQLASPARGPRGASLDHLIGGCKERRRDVETQRFRGLAVDHKLEFRWLLYRKFVRSRAAQDLIDVSCRTLRACVGVGPITEEGAFPCPRPKAGRKRQPLLA